MSRNCVDATSYPRSIDCCEKYARYIFPIVRWNTLNSISRAHRLVKQGFCGGAIYRSSSAHINNTKPQENFDASRVLVRLPLRYADSDSPKGSGWPGSGGGE